MKSDCPCGKPVDGAVLCQTCTERLDTTLTRLADLAADLHTLHSRQVRFGSGPQRRGAEQGLPWSERASQLLERLDHDTLGWTESLERHIGWSATRTPAQRLSWLRTRVARLRLYDEAADTLRGAESLLEAVETAVDRPPDRAYLGVCSCGTGVYAKPGETWVTCWCGLNYEVEARRAELLAKAEHMLLTPAMISTALTSLGQEVTPERIRKWAERKRLVSRGHDQRGRALFSVADVRALLASQESRKVAS